MVTSGPGRLHRPPDHAGTPPEPTMSKTLNVVPVTPADYRRLAERRLPRFLFDYIDGAANEELTAAANIEDFRRIRVRQRVMRDVADIDTRTTLAGTDAAMPLALAPVGMTGLFARRGEVRAARAAQASGVPFTLSTVSICPLAEVRRAVDAPFWFQLYMVRDRGVIRSLLDQAGAAGCTTLLFTVDLAVSGLRHRDTRNGIVSQGIRESFAKAWQIAKRPRWAWDVGLRGRPHTFGNLASVLPASSDQAAFRQWVSSQFDPSVTWRDIEWLRDIWPGRLLIKGVLDADDARAALSAGADGVVVSNHGGRQLDSAASSISKLSEVARALDGRAEIYLDGGVRSGVDVFKALALGAHGVLIGRPWAWALAAGGQAAVERLLANFQRELQVTMALTGVTRLAQIGPEVLDAACGSELTFTARGAAE